MNPRLYFDEKTLKKLGDVFVVNTYFPIKTVPDSADYFLLVYIAHSNAIHNIDNTSRKLKEGDVVLISPNVVNAFTCTHKDELFSYNSMYIPYFYHDISIGWLIQY